MEGAGAVALVTAIYDGGDGCIDKLCTNDDSTTQANIQPLYKEVMIARGITSKAGFWPKRKGGRSYVTDQGKLLLCIQPISKFLADPAHRCKSFGHGMYNWRGEEEKN